MFFKQAYDLLRKTWTNTIGIINSYHTNRHKYKLFIPTQELTSTEHMTSTTLDYTNLSYIHTYWLIFFIIKFW